MKPTIIWISISRKDVCAICKKDIQTAIGYSLYDEETKCPICEECSEKHCPELHTEKDRMSFD